MTREEAATIMEMFLGTWPQVRVTEVTVGVWWESSLQHCEFELAREVALDVIANGSGTFPTPAEFNGRKATIVRQRTALVPDIVDDEGERLPNPKAHEMFDKWREMLRHPGQSDEEAS